MNSNNCTSLSYSNADLHFTHDYLLPTINKTLSQLDINPSARVFDLGCGNGAVANWLDSKGFEVSGVDPSESGIAEANKSFPSLNLQIGSAYDPLQETFGTFQLVVSLEVVEHVYAPRDYTQTIWKLLEPDGYALISTPYHGYLKNLALAISGRMDRHFSSLWDGGHIKFWSPKTITTLLSESGLAVQKIFRVGRIPQFAKSMLVLAQKRN